MRFDHNEIPISREVPAAGTAEFHAWACALGHELARAGAGPVEGHLRALARRARELNVAAVSAGVLVDRHSPEVARARAFSRVTLALSALTPSRAVALAAVS